MPRLSVVMIVKNEEHCLLDCLESVREIADEVIIGDTGSTDQTAEVAAAWGAQVASIPWTNDFAAARNAVLALASGDWLLHLDADEMLDEESAHSIRHLVDQDAFGAAAVELLVANYCDDPRAWRWVPAESAAPRQHPFSGYLPVPLLRLFRNGQGLVYREAIHESITQCVRELGAPVVQRHDILIHHFGYQPEESRRGRKAELYLSIARSKREESPQDVKAQHDFAEQALACGLTEEAEQACRDALALDPVYLPSVMTLANICLNRGEIPTGFELLSRVEHHPDAPAHVSIGMSAVDYREGRLLQAMNRLERLLEREPRALLGRLYLARIYDRFNTPDRAMRQLQLARDAAPTVQEFQDRLEALKRRKAGEDYFQNGFGEQALDTLVSALRLDQEDPLIHNDLGVVLFSLGEHEKARRSFERALQLAPGLQEAEENLQNLQKPQNA